MLAKLCFLFISSLLKPLFKCQFRSSHGFFSKQLDILLGGALVIGLSFVSSPSLATLALRASVDSLVEQADRIIYAEVYAVKAVAKRGQKGEIYTHTLLDVLEYWKGKGPDEVTVQTLGGTFQNLTLKVAGTPQFQEGQKVILFLKVDRSKPLNYIVALAQGVFYIDETQQNWKEHSVIYLNPFSSPNPHIYQDLTGLSFYLPSLNSQQITIIDAEQVRPVIRKFHDLKRQIAQALLRPMTVDRSDPIDLRILRVPSE